MSWIKFKVKLFLNLIYKRINFESFLYNSFIQNESFTLGLIGAHDGVKFDFLFSFLNRMNPIGFALEPVPEYFELLQKNFLHFSKIELINKALHNELENVIIYKVIKEFENLYPDWITGCASFYKSHLLQHKVKAEHIEELTIKAITISELISNRNYKYDLIQIDTEGYDAEIVKDIIKNGIRSSIIKFEFVNIKSDNLHIVYEQLKDMGYFIFTDKTDKIAILKSRYLKALFKI
jgi:FkbM family methyltransferase